MNMELLISFKKSTRHNVNSETELVFHSGELHASSYVYCHPKEASYTFSSLSSMVIVLPLIRAAIFYLDEAVLILKIKKGVEAEDIDSSKVFDIAEVVSGDLKDKHVKFQPNDNVGRAKDVGSSQVFAITNTFSSEVEDTHVKFLHKGDIHDFSRNSDALEWDCETHDYFDPHDSMRVRSNTDVESNHALNSNTPFAMFYDAWEDAYLLSHQG